MKLKGKVLAGAGALAMASALIGVVAPAADAATIVGACRGAVSLEKITSPTKGVGLTDQTQRSVKIVGALAKEQTSKLVVNGGGNCSGVYRGGDKHVPTPAGGHGNLVLSTLTPTAESSVLSGNATCASGDTAQSVDASSVDSYPLTGKVTWKFSQTYVDLVTAATKFYTMQANVSVLGIGQNGNGPDVLDVGGVVMTGVNAGATLATFATENTSESSIWEDPVAKTGGANGFDTGYELDLSSAAGCADGTPNNANVLQVLTGGGAGSSSSLLSSTANGFVFEFGEP